MEKEPQRCTLTTVLWCRARQLQKFASSSSLVGLSTHLLHASPHATHTLNIDQAYQAFSNIILQPIGLNSPFFPKRFIYSPFPFSTIESLTLFTMLSLPFIDQTLGIRYKYDNDTNLAYKTYFAIIRFSFCFITIGVSVRSLIISQFWGHDFSFWSMEGEGWVFMNRGVVLPFYMLCVEGDQDHGYFQPPYLWPRHDCLIYRKCCMDCIFWEFYL